MNSRWAIPQSVAGGVTAYVLILLLLHESVSVLGIIGVAVVGVGSVLLARRWRLGRRRS
jgi:hypothetical protein